MSDEINHGHQPGKGAYERRDIGVAGVLYFLAGLVLAGVLVHFMVTGLFSYLEKQSEAQQAPLNPLVTNAPADTRHIPEEYKGNYEKYLQKNFPTPQLEIDERLQLNDVRLKEEQTLSTYDWVDEKAGSVRIPIERAMELVAQRGLPVRAQSAAEEAPRSAKAQPGAKKGSIK